MPAPAAPKRTVGIASGAFWDKTSYVFGRTAPDATVSAAKQAKDAERLVKNTLPSWRGTKSCWMARTMSAAPPCWLSCGIGRRTATTRSNTRKRCWIRTSPFGWRVKRFIHDRPAVRAALIAEAGAGDAAPEGMCLVTGDVAPIARLHPSIKGVTGAQSSGAALVSFNLDSFTSHGKTQGANAPVSEAAAFAYATALNGLLTASRTNAKGRPVYPNRVMLGETTVPFWAEHGDAESIVRAMIGDEEDEVDFDDALQSMKRPRPPSPRRAAQNAGGLPPAESRARLDPASRVYVLGLSPNAARLSVRFWVEQSLADFTQHFQLHWEDLKINPLPRPWPPPLWRLLLELAPQREPKNIPPHLSGEVMRAILTGLPYPRAFLIHTIMRIRAEGCQRARVALAKAVVREPLEKARSLVRQDPGAPSWKDPLVSLDRDEINVGYRLGRLFALLDYAQYLSVDSVNAGVKEKFFASASSTPRRIFPTFSGCTRTTFLTRKSPEKRDRANHRDRKSSKSWMALTHTCRSPRR